VLGVRLPYDDVHAVRERLFELAPHLKYTETVQVCVDCAIEPLWK
jgi:hypothetical protein